MESSKSLKDLKKENIFTKANKKKEAKTVVSKLNQPFMNINGYGLHSCTKNSLVKVHPLT